MVCWRKKSFRSSFRIYKMSIYIRIYDVYVHRHSSTFFSNLVLEICIELILLVSFEKTFIFLFLVSSNVLRYVLICSSHIGLADGQYIWFVTGSWRVPVGVTVHIVGHENQWPPSLCIGLWGSCVERTPPHRCTHAYDLPFKRDNNKDFAQTGKLYKVIWQSYKLIAVDYWN